MTEIKVRLIMEATYDIDPSSEGYQVETLEEAVEIDRRALFGEGGLDAQLAMDAIGFTPVKLTWEEVDHRCRHDLSRRPEWMGVDQYDPCRCIHDVGHEGPHECKHGPDGEEP